MSFQDSYSQAPLTFVDTGGDYGADTQGMDYEYAFSLSQTQSQTQASQLTQNEPRATGNRLTCYSVKHCMTLLITTIMMSMVACVVQWCNG